MRASGKTAKHKKKTRLETPVTHYPFSPEEISKRDAIELIRAVVYTNTSTSIAEKRIRARIASAIKEGSLPRTSMLCAPSFFDWALSNKSWKKSLADLPLLPRIIKPISIDGCEVNPSHELFSVDIPVDPLVLREKYEALQFEHQRLIAQYKELEAKNQLYLEELEAFRSKKALKSDSARANALVPRIKSYR